MTKDINDAENPIRRTAIRILEAIAEKSGNPNAFDNVKGKAGVEPDGTWYEYEDLVTEILAGDYFTDYDNRGKMDNDENMRD